LFIRYSDVYKNKSAFKQFVNFNINYFKKIWQTNRNMQT
jgi:hypothetical protein